MEPGTNPWRVTAAAVLLAAPLGGLVGLAVAFFLWALDQVTTLRFAHPWLLYCLPVAGVSVSLLYHWFGKAAEAGHNLILDQIHRPGGGVPWRMAPLVLAGTLATHLCGGSAGREGTAVQMGGSLAGGIAQLLRLDPRTTRLLLMAGMSAGFGAVFGTPLAGVLFALEVLFVGRLDYDAVAPCLVAAWIGDGVATACGATHAHYSVTAWVSAPQVNSIFPWDLTLVGKTVIAGGAFGAASFLFAWLAHRVQALLRTRLKHFWMRPLVGGVVVVLLASLLNANDYLGLGVIPDPHSARPVTIASCFEADGAQPLSWWWKTVFTATTVGSGFKGGEVTPLFFVGAALGNFLANVLNAPVDLFAALGFVALFAGATKTPLASTVMAIELFAARSDGALASGFAIYAAIACFVSYYASGTASIYAAQRRPNAQRAT
jgi:H+/Cl- antiporter ClcA